MMTDSGLMPGPGASRADRGDEVLQVTTWSPIRMIGARFCTHRLKTRAPKRVEFALTPGAAAVCFALAAAGAFIALNVPSSGQPTAVMLLGAALIGAGAWAAHSLARPLVFDRTRGWFWRGSKPTSRPSANGGGAAGTLDEIHALQLIESGPLGLARLCCAHELKLVLHDGSRINATRHGNLAKLRDDAEQLAAFLNVPLWDSP